MHSWRSWRSSLLASLFLCQPLSCFYAAENSEPSDNAAPKEEALDQIPESEEPVDEFARMAERSPDEKQIPPVELNGFGTGEPLERVNMPTRGLLTFPLDIDTRKVMPHWEQYDWTGVNKRSGKFRVVATYEARHSIPVQFHHQKLRLRKELPTAKQPLEATIGVVDLAKGDFAFSIYAPPPPAPGRDVLHIHDVKFIPIPQEGDVDNPLAPDEQGILKLSAAQATLWSESLSLKPGEKETPASLVSWHHPEDLAEWHVKLSPGHYQCTVIAQIKNGEVKGDVLKNLKGELITQIDEKKHRILSAPVELGNTAEIQIPFGDLQIHESDLSTDLCQQFVSLKFSAPLPDHVEIMGVQLKKAQAAQTAR